MRQSFLLAILMAANFVEAADAIDIPQQLSTSSGAFLVRSIQEKNPELAGVDAVIVNFNKEMTVDKISSSENKFSTALTKAWKPTAIQEGVEASKKTLLECQKETSMVFTTPMGHNDSQQDHCFRF